MTAYTKTLTTIALTLAALLLSSHVNAETLAWNVTADGMSGEPSIDAVLVSEGGHYWALISDIAKFGFDISKLPTVNGKIDLSEIGKLAIDELNGAIKIDVKPDLKPPTKIDFSQFSLFMEPMPQADGWFVNYDTRVNQIDGAQNPTRTIATMFDANTFLNGIRLNYQGLLSSGNTTVPAFQRIAAGLSYDNVKNATTWIIGDGYSAPGDSINPVSFTGFQYKSDYTLQPGFITQPTYSLSGLAAAPSTISVLMDNRKIMTQQVQPGPFAITNLVPFIGPTGVQIVVTDIFGQQQIINKQIMGSPNILKRGLDNFGIQGGLMRPTFWRNESLFFSGFYRRGLTDSVTLEANAEKSISGSTLPAVQHVGVNGAFSTQAGNFSFGARIGTGRTTNATWQDGWRGENWLASVGASVTKSTPDYLIMGGTPSYPLIKSLQGMFQSGHYQFSALQTSLAGNTVSTLSFAEMSKSAKGISWSLSLTQTASPGQPSQAAGFLSATLPIDSMPDRIHMASAGVSRANGTFGQTTEYTDSPTNGFGYATTLHEEHSAVLTRGDVEVDYLGYRGEGGAAVSRSITPGTGNNQTGYRFYARGSVVENGGNVGFSRWIDGGFVAVDSGAPNARVMVNNMDAGETNNKGFAVVSRGISPFFKTSVELNPNDLPDNFDGTPVDVSTYRKAGVTVRFRAKSSVMVYFQGKTSGVLRINGVDYPITDRGAYVELPEGEYTGTVGQERIRFSIPKPAKGMSVQTIQAKEMP